MLKYVPTNETFEEIIVTSKNRAKNLGALNNSIREGAGNFVGYVGQISIAKLLGIDEVDTFDHDLQYQDMTLEVKSKDRTVDPALYYDASIAKTSMHQNPDIYVFVSVTIPANTTAIEAIWIMGWISKKNILIKLLFIKKGILTLAITLLLEQIVIIYLTINCTL